MARQTHVYVGAQRARGSTEGGVFRLAVGEKRWEKLAGGLPGEADVPALTVDPNNADVIYAGTKDGLYRSTDRGAHWQRLGFAERGVEVWSVLVHPKRPKTLYAGVSPVGVYRSDDSGDTWRKLRDPAIANRVTMSFACRVMRFAVDPAEPDTLYATVEANGVMRSRDAGETWEDCSTDLLKLAELPHLKSRIVSDSEAEGMLDGHALCASPASPGTVIVALRMGLFRSKDRGSHWHDMEVGRFSPLRYSRDIRVSPHDPRTLFACLSVAASSDAGSVYRSTDVGETWQRFDEGLSPASTMMAVTPHPTDPKQVYCVARRGEVFGTQDAGKTWQAYPLPADVTDNYAIACS